MKLVQPVEWLGDRARIIDQTQLPLREVHLEFTDYRDMATAIKELKVRGAPAIGVAAAYAVSLGALKIQTDNPEHFRMELAAISRVIAATRPTARNLFRSLERLETVVSGIHNVRDMRQAVIAEAMKIHREEIEAARRISDFGAALIPDKSVIMTHCNAGPLAATGYGTALGIILRASELGKKVKVFANETRPLLQGARLTIWELQQADIPVTLITDSMAGYILHRGGVNAIIVGADRITANGDTANKIGTYTLAVLARENKVPFYVAAPFSTIDASLPSGDKIVIEERSGSEVTSLLGVKIVPEGTETANPAFDVTPYRYITAIITEKGIFQREVGRRYYFEHH